MSCFKTPSSRRRHPSADMKQRGAEAAADSASASPGSPPSDPNGHRPTLPQLAAPVASARRVPFGARLKQRSLIRCACHPCRGLKPCASPGRPIAILLYQTYGRRRLEPAQGRGSGCSLKKEGGAGYHPRKPPCAYQLANTCHMRTNAWSDRNVALRNPSLGGFDITGHK